MNVKVITRQGPSNYGSLLQSIATIRAVESLGHNCEIIDYERDDERGLGAILTEVNAKPAWNKNFLKKALYIALRYPVHMIAQHRFDAYRRKYLKLTSRVSSHEQLSQLSADIFLTGSDQVWGPIGRDNYDPAYLLDFVKDGIKASYAASFGHASFSPEAQRAFSELLPQYQSVAVRESNALDIVKKYGVDHAEQVLDPTLLLNASQWSEYIEDSDKAPDEKYILIYQIHQNPELSEYALNLSKRTGLPLYRVSPYLHQIFRGGKFVFLPTVGKFLSMIKSASLLVTDSFHGTAFAINFNTPFIEILPGNGTASRNQSILKLTGLSDRIITDYNDFETAMQPIDYTPVNQIIEHERKESFDYLKKLLS